MFHVYAPTKSVSLSCTEFYGQRVFADAKQFALSLRTREYESASQLARRFDRVVFKRTIRIILENRGPHSIQGIKSTVIARGMNPIRIRAMKVSARTYLHKCNLLCIYIFMLDYNFTL